MKTTVLQENFYKGLAFAYRFVPNKVQLPILSNFLLEVKNGQIIISATNLESGIKIVIPAKVEEEGSVIVPAKTLTEMIAGFPKDKISLSIKDKKLEVICQGHKVLINMLPTQEFPSFPQPAKKKKIILKQELLKELSHKILFSASQDETRPTLTGILVLLKKELVTFVATDGFRLSLMTKKGVIVEEEDEILLPAKILLEASRVVADFGQEEKQLSLEIIKESNQVIFWGEEFSLFGRIIEGKFPPYEKIIPKSFVSEAVVDKESLLDSVKIASIFARDAANLLKIKTGKKLINVSANAPQTGENTNEVEAQTEGEETEIAFNSRYLLDFLNNTEEEQVRIQFSGALNPAVFKGKKDEEFFHIIMPVRVQG